MVDTTHVGDNEYQGAEVAFLSTKLSPPLYSIELVQRRNLIDLLNTGLDRKIILLHAPAGYGKTTLLYQWYQHLSTTSEINVCWLTLEQGDQDPTRFLYHLLCSIGSLSNKLSSLKDLANKCFYNANILLLKNEVLTTLNRIEGKALIIIDDYHLAGSDENDKLLAELLNNAPNNIIFVLSSRFKPEIPFSYFKCQGKLLELEVDRLRFSKLESLQLFGENASSSSMDSLFNKTEGWPVVLQLAKLWMIENQASSDLASIDLHWETGDEVADIADYLSAEVLKNLRPEVTDVLLDTSVLDQINGDLANFITRRNDCWEIFQSLRSLDALVVLISKKGAWFRYHHVFAEFLQSRLVTKGQDRVLQLHKRACDWFLNHDNLEYAVKHACKAGDKQKALAIIEQAGAVRIALTGGMPLLRKLLQYLDVDTIYSSPRVHLAKIWMLIKEGQVSIARAQYNDYLKTANNNRCEEDNIYSDLAKESLFVGMMLTEIYEDKDFGKQELVKVEEMVRDVSMMDHWFQGWVNNLLCVMHIRRGNMHNALAVNESAVYHYQQVNSDYGQVFMLLHLSVIHLLSGNLSKAYEYIGKAHNWCEADFSSDVGLLSLIGIVKGSVLFERNKLENAAETIFPALDIAEKAEGWVELYVQGYRSAAQIAYVENGLEDAMKFVDKAMNLANERNLPRLQWQAYCLQVELLTLNGQLSEATVLMNANNIALTSKPEFITWREKQLSLVSLARLAIYQGEAANIIESLKSAIEKAEKYGRQGIIIELSVILSLAYFDLEDRDLCVAALRKALHVAVAESYKRVFVKEGAMMARMLKVVIRHVGVAEMPNETVSFLAALLTDLKSGDSSNDLADERSILTERELAVLDELVKGSVNKIIARNLDLSLATIKFHLSNIYKKLGVSSRVMAVAVAKKKNLI